MAVNFCQEEKKNEVTNQQTCDKCKVDIKNFGMVHPRFAAVPWVSKGSCKHDSLSSLYEKLHIGIS